VVGRRAAPAARRPAGHPSRPHRRRLRLDRQGRDARGRGAGAAERGRLVYTGVATPERWESTPIYFKEITVAGSNAFGVEDFEGTRRHAIAHYLQLVADGRLDITPMLTHRFALEEWWPALKALARQDRSGALKVAFTPNS
jgi:threonine dehydrogenase-like Zn-dependent dehydrogenase